MTFLARPSALFQSAFSDDRFSSAPDQRDRFRNTLARAREKAGQLAVEIPRGLPHFTQHDVTHMDALWELADTIAGGEAELNPAEGFVFGVAVLVHDLAMSHAAYKLQGTSVREQPDWADTLAGKFRARVGRAPSAAEMMTPPQDLALEAEQELLRRLHSSSAEKMPTIEWERQDGSKEYLIDDPELRGAYGHLIGRIAASHHWDKGLLRTEFETRAGAVSFAPVDWTVDSLILACLLRTADAAHIDAGRSPAILASAREITGESSHHWGFQSKMQRPYLRNGRLVFTAPPGFNRSEIPSWWLAFDVLTMIDGELHGVDNILADANRIRFAAKGVADVESPKTCQKHLPCHGWEPVAARVQVSDVAGLVRRLGGVGLYGHQPVAGVRELVMNACDAVSALAALHSYKGLNLHNGRVNVSLDVNDAGSWLTVEDNGIGMTPHALTTALLDFGRSSWLDPAVAGDNPGLIASSFAPSGRYGIGFFACFMLGNRVEVHSRARSAGPAETWVLEFGDGLERRPTLRRGDNSEELVEPGTRVRILLDEGLVDEQSQLCLQMDRFSKFRPATRLAVLMPELLPASPVDIWTRDWGETEFNCVVHANDWMSISGAELISRVAGHERRQLSPDAKRKEEAIFAELSDTLQVVHSDEGIPVARISRLPSSARNNWSRNSYSVVTAGPARTGSAVNGVAGIFIGYPDRASRDGAIPLVTKERIATWASEQAELASISGDNNGGDQTVNLAMALHELGGDTGVLKAWLTRHGWLDYGELVEWLGSRSKVLCISTYQATVTRGNSEELIALGADVLVCQFSYMPALSGNDDWPEGLGMNRPFGQMFILAHALADAWGGSSQSLSDQLRRRSKNEDERIIGTHQGEVVNGYCTVVNRES